MIGPSSSPCSWIILFNNNNIYIYIYIKKRQSLGALIWATISWHSWPVVDGQREIDQFFLHGITKLFNLTCCRLEDRLYFSLTFMWESYKYREDTYHLQKSFSKFVMDKSYFSLTFMWESNKYREDTYHLQKLSWTSRIFHWRLCEKAINIGKIHTTCKSCHGHVVFFIDVYVRKQ